MNKFKRSSKGFSTVVGTIFLVLILMTVATSVFLYTFTQNATYNQAVKESSQTDADRYSERIVAYDTDHSYSGGITEVNTTLTAYGPLSAQIIRIWVTWKTENDIKYGSEDIEINVPSGLTKREGFSINVARPDNTYEFDGWFITARGNRIPLMPRKIGETVIVANVAQGIGAIAMDFTDFKYFEIDGAETHLLDYDLGGYSAFELHKNEKFVFALTLTNWDMQNRTISLNQNSALWIYFPQATGGSSRLWAINKVDSTGNIIPYENIELSYGVPTRVYFGGYGVSIQTGNVAGAVNLILLGSVESEYFGQNIPFVSIYVLP